MLCELSEEAIEQKKTHGRDRALHELAESQSVGDGAESICHACSLHLSTFPILRFLGFSAKFGSSFFKAAYTNPEGIAFVTTPITGLQLLPASSFGDLPGLFTSNLPTSHRENQAKKKNNYKEERGVWRGGLGYFFFLV